MRSEPSMCFGLNSEPNRFACECCDDLATTDLCRMPQGEIPERNQCILHCLSKDTPYDTHILTVMRR
jgi:hypothetical protein